jgi:hypothetical protein
MCKNCKGSLKLISYTWNSDELIYKYQCENCDEIVEVTKQFDEEELKNNMFNNDFYNNL